MGYSHTQEPAAFLACPLGLKSTAAQKCGPVTTAPGPAAVLRVYLVDDEPVICLGLRGLLNRTQGYLVCGEAGSEKEALKGILSEQPDLVIVELSLSQGCGLSLIRRLHECCPTLKILVFSGEADAQLVASAFAAGAHGYLLKGEGATQILEAIQKVHRWGYYLSPGIAGRVSSGH